MFCSWQVSGAAGANAPIQHISAGSYVKAMLDTCKAWGDCSWLRIGYIRVLLPATITTWRLDLVFSPSDDSQGVILLTDSANAQLVDDPRIGVPATWRDYRPFPGVPCTSRLDQSSLRLLCSPLPVATWSATLDLDFFTPNPHLEPCQ